MDALSASVLLLPAGLWGLVALAAPIIIHLVNRSRGKRVLVGNIALLRVVRRRRAREIRMERWLLLLLRLLILALAALILARWALPGLRDEPRDTVYLTPAAWSATAAETGNENVDHRLLAPGFPALDTAAATPEGTSTTDTWALLAERLATVHHTGNVEIVTTGRAGEFGPRAPTLARPVNWSARLEGDGGQPTSTAAPDFNVRIVHDGTRLARTALVESALSAIQRHRAPGMAWEVVAPAAITAAPGDAETRLVWLAEAPPPVAGDAETHPVVVTERDLAWPRNGSDPGFAQELLWTLLTPGERAQRYDHAPVDLARIAELAAPGTAGDAPDKPWRPLQPWLALLLVALWSLERWLSERRHG